MGNSLVGQWLGLHAYTAGGMGLIPGQGTKIPWGAQHGQKKPWNLWTTWNNEQNYMNRCIFPPLKINSFHLILQKNMRLPKRLKSFPGCSVVKNRPANAGVSASIPGLERYPGEGNDNPLQYSSLGNPMDRGVWWATVHRVTKSQTWLERLNRHKKYVDSQTKISLE